MKKQFENQLKTLIEVDFETKLIKVLGAVNGYGYTVNSEVKNK